MDQLTRRRQQAHVRAHAECAEQRPVFQASDGGTEGLALLGDSIDSMKALAVEQARCLEDRRAAGKACLEARLALYAGLKPVVKISAFVKLDAGSAEVMQLPRRDGASFIDGARAIVEKVTPYTAAFIKAGLPAHILANLPTQIDAYVAARLALEAAQRRYTAAKKAMPAKLNSGDRGLAVLETILSTTPGVDPKAVTRLQLAKRVGPRVTNHATEPASATQTSQATTTPTTTARTA